MAELLSRLGARLGNWNDSTNGTNLARWSRGIDGPRRPRLWALIDPVAGWLYTLPDRGGD